MTGEVTECLKLIDIYKKNWKVECGHWGCILDLKGLLDLRKVKSSLIMHAGPINELDQLWWKGLGYYWREA